MRHDYRSDVLAFAYDFAVKAKALKQCERHEGIYSARHDPEADRLAYALATIAVKQGKAPVDLQELRDAIKYVIEQAIDGPCPECPR
jgi:hypothetical protein